MHPTSPSLPISPTPPETKAASTAPGTLFPHVLIDEVLPTVSGSEWQLLTIIVRQTLGWHDPATGGRKKSDWLSHSQLKARTGRGSEAVSHAVNSLVHKTLIEVRDEQGKLMASSEERRRSCSRLFYSLSPQLLARFQSPLPSVQPHATVSVSRTGKSETTKETETNYLEKAFRKPERSSSTKGIQNLKVVRADEDGCGCFRPLKPPTSPTAAIICSTPQAPSGKVLRFLKAFQEKRGQGEVTVPSLEPDEETKLQAALERFGFERLVQLTDVFLASDITYVRRHGYTLPTFLAVLNVLPILRP